MKELWQKHFQHAAFIIFVHSVHQSDLTFCGLQCPGLQSHVLCLNTDVSEESALSLFVVVDSGLRENVDKEWQQSEQPYYVTFVDWFIASKVFGRNGCATAVTRVKV